MMEDNKSIEECLSDARALVVVSLEKSREAKVFASRWKLIISKLEQIPLHLSDLSSHPCFAKSSLCKEQLLAVSETLRETMTLADTCIRAAYDGKLRMQNDLDNLLGKLSLNLKDCGVLIKTGVLGEVALPSSVKTDTSVNAEVREMLARLQIGNLEAKHRALDSLVGVMKEEEKTVMSVLGRSNISALVQLLTATSPQIREKTVAIICSLTEAGCCEKWLVTEGVLPPLIRLAESGSAFGKEKATISLQRLSMSGETSRAIVGHGGVPPLVEICESGDSISQAAATCALKNVSAVPEVRQTLVDEGIIKLMINLLRQGVLLGTKEYAAECLQNLSASEKIRREVVSEGGVESLLEYLDGPLPQESAVAALRNIVTCVSTEKLVLMGFLPRLVHVLKSGSSGAQQAAACAISKVCVSMEMKKMVGEAGCIPLLVKLLEAKTNNVREASAQAISILMGYAQNRREVKREEKSVPSLVQLLDPSAQNTAKKFAVGCLLLLSPCRKCRKMMTSYGAIGYLKKLADVDVAGAKRLLARLERGRIRNLFMRK